MAIRTGYFFTHRVQKHSRNLKHLIKNTSSLTVPMKLQSTSRQHPQCNQSATPTMLTHAKLLPNSITDFTMSKLPCRSQRNSSKPRKSSASMVLRRLGTWFASATRPPKKRNSRLKTLAVFCSTRRARLLTLKSVKIINRRKQRLLLAHLCDRRGLLSLKNTKGAFTSMKCSHDTQQMRADAKNNNGPVAG